MTPFLITRTSSKTEPWTRAALDLDDAQQLLFDQLIQLLGERALGHPAAITVAHMTEVGLRVRLFDGTRIDCIPVTCFDLWTAIGRPIDDWGEGPGMPDLEDLVALFNLRALGLVIA